MLLQEGDVFEEELLLKIFRAGGDDDALSGKQRGDQVSQSFTGSRSGLDDQVALLLQSAFHRFCHLHLSRAELIIRVPLRERAAAREEPARLARGRRLLEGNFPESLGRHYYDNRQMPQTLPTVVIV